MSTLSSKNTVPVIKRQILLLLILLAAVWLRFNGLNEPGFWLDEIAYTVAAQNPIID